MKKNRAFLIGYLFLCVIFIFSALEMGAKLLLRDRYSRDERNLAYSYDAVLGWFPGKNSKSLFKSIKNIQIQHNDLGFRDIPIASDKRHPRIAFLGDSYVWGYDVEQGEIFTQKLRLQRPEMEFVNMGVSAFSTDQELLLLMRDWERVKPDLVMLMVSANDRSGNASNMSYGYYKPYFTLENDRLKLQGVPVSKNAMYQYKDLRFGLNRSSLVLMILKIAENFETGRHFLKRKLDLPDPTETLVYAMNKYLSLRKTGFVVALVDADESLERYCRERSIRVLDLSSVNESFRFPSHGQHWNPQGHARVAELVGQFLRSAAA